jgi:hypothetical protein
MTNQIYPALLVIGCFILFIGLICIVWLYMLKRFPNGDLTYRIERNVSTLKALKLKLTGTEFEKQASDEITILLTNAEMVLAEEPPVTTHLQNCLEELESELAKLQAMYPLPKKTDGNWPIIV